MIRLLWALAGLALTVAVPAQAAKSAKSVSEKAGTHAPPFLPTDLQPAASPPAQPANGDAAGGTIPSAATARVADWIAATGDNHSLPYAIIDKQAASLFLFDAKRKPIGRAPVLTGVAIGDDATPGIGSKDLSKIGPAEKTTPAGRFLAKFGMAAGKQKVLWVDYTLSVALHPIPPGASKKERRSQRMLSPTPDDNRITFGCINVPLTFYTKKVSPLFRRKGGYVYVLPDTKPIEKVFPGLLAQGFGSGGAP